MDSETRRLIDTAPLVIADFDGTLVRLNTDWQALKSDLVVLSRKRGWTWNRSDGIDANLRRIRREHGELDFATACDHVAMAEYAGFHPSQIATDLVEALADRLPDPVVIVSNNTRIAIERILSDPAFTGFNPLVIGKEDVWESKPSPVGVQRACRLFVVSPSRAVMIGDTQADIDAARAAGLRTFIHVTPPDAADLRKAA